jgi:hypothetical protein
MSETTTNLVNRFLALPRAMQWALLAIAGMLLFVTWDRGINPISDWVSRKSSGIEQQVREVRASRQISGDFQRMEPLVVSLGPVQAPRSEAAGSAAFTTLVNDLMKKHGITDQNFNLRQRGNLPKNALTEILQGKRAERLTADLKFSAKPEVAVAILADLESSPDIEQISQVRLTKDQNGKVKAAYVLEAWVTAGQGAAPGASIASAGSGAGT